MAAKGDVNDIALVVNRYNRGPVEIYTGHGKIQKENMDIDFILVTF